MLTETTFDAFASGSDGIPSGSIPGSQNRDLSGSVGVAGCMMGHSGTKPTAAVGV